MALPENRSADPAPAPAPEAARQTLATRIAERNRLRELRAERLARLPPGEAGADISAAAAVPDAAPEMSAPAASDAAQDALEHFLRALTGGLAGVAPAPAPAPELAPGPEPEPAAVLRFQRPEAVAAAPCDLDRLPGAGPGLVWALQRAGIARRADLAGLEAATLAARLGPLGRLVPAEAWIKAARAAGGEAGGQEALSS